MPDSIIIKAYCLYEAGQYAQAARMCLKILSLNPEDHKALTLLGVVSYQSNDKVNAILHLLRAVALDNNYIPAYRSIATVFMKENKFDYAIRLLSMAININQNEELYEDIFTALTCYASDFHIRLKHRKAEQYVLHALNIFPANENALLLYAKILNANNNHVDATKIYDKLISISPGNMDYGINYGMTLFKSCQYKNALDFFINMNDNFVNANLLYSEDHNKDAFEITNCIAMAYGRLNEVRSSLKYFYKSLSLNPGCSKTFYSIGELHFSCGDLDEAVRFFEYAIAANPLNSLAMMKLADTYLFLDDTAKSWETYRNAWILAHRHFKAPWADFSDAGGKRIFIHNLGGFGDLIQYLRYVKELIDRNAEVIMEHSPLDNLIKTSLPECSFGDADKTDFDVIASLMSLPCKLEMDLEHIPCPIPYIKPDPELSGQFAQRLANAGKLKVGVCRQAGECVRMIGLEHFRILAGVENVMYFCLQKGGREEFSAIFPPEKFHDLGHEIDEHTGAFAETAALISNLDVVVTSDTSIGHLAGAMGKPVFLCLSHRPDGRWRLGRKDTPWYPHHRLFRQPEPGDWESVFSEVGKEIEYLAGTKSLL